MVSPNSERHFLPLQSPLPPPGSVTPARALTQCSWLAPPAPRAPVGSCCPTPSTPPGPRLTDITRNQLQPFGGLSITRMWCSNYRILSQQMRCLETFKYQMLTISKSFILLRWLGCPFGARVHSLT